jgi:hypothetical protein
MADWKQIQGRIRRAKTSADPPGKLIELYEKTRDAMVAFELGQHFERAGDASGAGRWYSTAAQAFRRPQWKAKAQEALVRLGMSPGAAVFDAGAPVGESAHEEAAWGGPEVKPAEETRALAEIEAAPTGAAPVAGSTEGPKKRRRRGVRGGRRHRRGRGKIGVSATPTAEVASRPAPTPQGYRAPENAPVEPSLRERREEARWTAPPPARVQEEETHHEPSLFLRGRAGDPGLSSRMALLESQLRRLLACTPGRLDQADRAPAGPGVFLITDSDQLTNYYVEACQTLRIGIGNVLKERRQSPGRNAGSPLRTRLAKHLGITEAKAVKYFAEHCTIRWLQLDDGAPYLANFAIAVLRPILNNE